MQHGLSITPAIKMPRQEDHKFKASLDPERVLDQPIQMCQDSVSKLKAPKTVVWHSDTPRAPKREGQGSMYFPTSSLKLCFHHLHTATLSDWRCAPRKGRWSTVDSFSLN